MSDFRSALLRIMDHKDHWAWPVFGGPTATLPQLRVHFQQEYAVYVRDFPVFLSRIHSRCPLAEVRRDLAENIYEEDTGGLSGTGPHPDLFLYMMEGLGLKRREFSKVELLDDARRYRTWLDEATLEMPWVVAAAVVTIFVEGSVHERRELNRRSLRPALREDTERQLIRDNPLVRFHGLDPRFLKLKMAHARVEAGHRHAVWQIVLDHARTAEEKKACVAALQKSLEMWQAYRDGVADAAGIPRQTRRAARRLAIRKS